MMGVPFSDTRTRRLLWLCSPAVILLLILAVQVSADSKIDTDLVFDNLETTHLKSHENHRRIERDISEEEIVPNASSVEDENWLVGSVKRLKRSISGFFNTNEDQGRKPQSHHTKNSERVHKRVKKSKDRTHVPSSPSSSSKRKHRQAGGQQEAEDEYDEEGDQIGNEGEDDDEYGDDYDENEEYYDATVANGSSNGNAGALQVDKWTDDEDDLTGTSGEGSTEEVLITTEEPYIPASSPPRVNYGHPRVYRVIFTLQEPYQNDFNDRNSVQFRTLAARIKTALENLLIALPGDQQASVISLQKTDSDTFHTLVTVDVDSDGFYDGNRIKRAILQPIEDNRRIDDLIVSPQNFYFREFGESQPYCESNQLQCRSGECVPLNARCNGLRDCNDNTDEEGCVEPETTEQSIPVEPDVPFTAPSLGYPGQIVPETTTTTTETQTVDSTFEGSGDECRADDSVRCPDGSRSICADQRCDGIRDCDDGSDELNCPHAQECAIGEFKCDVSRCIPETSLCDNRQDCSDGTDEHNCAPKCRSDEHQCDNRCISRDQVCDRRQDCDDGSDEANCPASQCRPDEFSCGDGQCILGYLRCDRNVDCRNGNDELNCSITPECLEGEGRVSCQDGSCVPGKRCDNFLDCVDASDERGCPGVCALDQFKCDDGACVDERLRCDNLRDCLDGSDEKDCVSQCPGDQFRCSDGLCLIATRRCDGSPDCVDGSDEEGCARNRTCENDEFDCGEKCISLKSHCDGYHDCENGQDEVNCGVKCAADEFECPSDRTCIPTSRRCDRRQDCSDGSDEFDCPPAQRCSPNQLTCSDGSCFEVFQQCNGIRDCPSGSDEEGCPCQSNEFQCLDGQCIDQSLRCNRRYDCRDRSDEENCPTEPPFVPPEPTPSPISCPSGYRPCKSLTQCIRLNQFCDGRVDCTDLSDEDCPGTGDGLNLRTYPSSQEIKENREVVFQCRDEGPLRARVHWARPNGEALPLGSVDRNGRLEIPNIKVQDSGTYLCIATGYPAHAQGAVVPVELVVSRWEPPPTLPSPTACGLYEATCSNGQCIDKNKVCDGNYDCADGSDENRCNANGCEPNEFQCDNRKCVLKTWRCDSEDDCGDGSDERNCRPSQPGEKCPFHQFACRSNDQCIPRSYHCDVERDCIDGSDEVGCSKPVISKPPPPMVNLREHETFRITCTAVGIPTPEIVWRLNWGHVPLKCRTTSVDGVGELICEDIQVEDQGAYSCEAINIKGSTFAVPDTILIVQRDSPCRPGYFNDEARSEGECIKCFCFGHSTSCRSADLFIYQFQPPFDTLRLLGVRVDPISGVVDIRDEPIYRGAIPQLTSLGPNGVSSTAPEYAELSQPNVVPYFAMPENYHGNQLKSYGGYLRYTVRHSNRGYPTPGPSVIISGNGYILLHESRQNPLPNSNQDFEVRFFEGEWIRKSDREPQTTATREEIMMVLEDIDNILIKLQYNNGILNTSLTNIEMDSAAAPNSGLGEASFVEECTCPVGYTGSSCEKCADGYVRRKSGPWLGQCYKEPQSCPPGRYLDGDSCQVCPCPLTNPSNQFGRTCHLGPGNGVICDCPPGYEGDRCQYCSPGYVGDPLTPGDSCKPVPSDNCSPAGSFGTDASGRCRCKDLTEGPYCNRCKPNTFHLSPNNVFGCVVCFCMGVTRNCTSSNWYRERVVSEFTNSLNDFKLIESQNRDYPIEEGIRLNQPSREIVYNNFVSPNVYYWSLPSRFLGNKITSYGGNLKYTLRHTPVPGGQSSRNSAADVELISKNQYHLRFFNRNQTYPTSGPQTFVVPILEQYWQRYDGKSVDREHLLMALADLDAIYIKATYYTNTEEASLISVSLDIATERNTGLERALEVEQCQCPQGYSGLSCEDCDVGYTRNNEGIYLGLCEPCNCNGHSNQCDPDTGVCYNCRDSTTGENCEECLPGYTGDPVNGIPCQYGGNQPPCNCDPRGSVSNECHNGRCVCKVNVEGNNCDRCRPGAFGLRASNIDGCEFCFCSGVATECRESNFYYEQIPKPFSEDHGYTLTDQSQQRQALNKFNVDPFFTEISYNFLPSERDTLFWSLPGIFTGNQIRSYGGRLEFIQRYTQRPGARYVPDRDVIIKGNGITIYWSNPAELREEIAHSASILLHPSGNWTRIEQRGNPKPASREDILTVLANVDAILIRATQSSDTSTAYLSEVTLDTAVAGYTGRPEATTVEVCTCPTGYRGTSCESCAPGYYKDFYYDASRPLGSCQRCPCNDRASGCDTGPNNRVICHCQPGYTGDRCEFEATSPPLPPPDNSTPRPITIDMTIIDHHIEIYEVGSTVRYNCTATSRLSRPVRIWWGRDGDDLPNRAVDDGRGLLVITDLRVSDSGRYVCQASDGISVTTNDVNLTVGVPRDEPPRIVPSTTYVEVNEGQRVEVTCAAQGVPTPNLRLLRLDNKPLNPNGFYDNGNFRIDQVTKADEAEYQCIATNRAGSDSASFQIRVNRGVINITRVDIRPQYFTGQAGETVVLRCSPIGDVQSLRWSKQGGQLPYNSREDRGVLTITNAGAQDSGVYICTAVTYSGSPGTGRATVSITDSSSRYPTAKVSPERLTISEGQSAEIECTASGVPPPSIKWTRIGSELSNNMRQIGFNLHIDNARLEDRGIYVCVATNSHGLEQASAMVEVTRGSEFPRLELYPAIQQTVLVGNSAILQCRAVAGYPSPRILWSRADRQPLSSNIEEMSEGTLRFTGITPNEDGEYICSATNDAGTATATATIIVHTPPRIQITPEEDVIRRNEGDYLRIECEGTGIPPPNVSWQKYNYDTPPAGQRGDGGRDYISSPRLLQNVAYQEFFRLTKEDEGLYICRAQSSAGLEEKRVQLLVNTNAFKTYNTSPPLAAPGYDERFTAPVGTRAEIRCRIQDQQGSHIRVSWIRTDNSSLPQDAYERSGTLYIDNVQPSASGEYQCLGMDPYGNVLFRIATYLEVIFPPRITLHPPKQVVHPGDNAYINCSATGQQPMTISWSPLGRELPSSVYTRDGIIRFSNIQLQDAGRYLCKANNSAGEADAVADVIVEENYSKPAIAADQRQLFARLGSSVSLRCRAANPTHAITWFRENHPLPRDSQINGEFLYIYNVQSPDEGRYFCKIATERGTSSDYIDLRLSEPEELCQPTWFRCENRNCIPPQQICDSINDCGDNSDERNCQTRRRRGPTGGTPPPTEAPQPTLYISPPESDHFIGESIDILCQSSEPGAITTWKKVQGWLANNVETAGGSLRIRNLHPENAGVYRCEASGQQGVYYKDYNLVVNDEVKDQAPIEVKNAPRGSDIILECKTDLNEPVTYLWTKQGGELPHYVEAYSKQIQLNNIGSADAGTYTCSASSGVRSTDVPIILVVTGIVPYFTQAPNSYITFPMLGDSFFQFSFEISVKPERGDGLILYNGGDKKNAENGDFIALLLVDGVPEFRFNLGQGATTVRADRPISNKEFHTIKVVRNRKKVMMYVDGEGPFIATSPGRYMGLDLSEPLYLGGVPDANNISPEIYRYSRYVGFVGCISLFKIGHVHEDILRDSLNQTGITTCETCSENTCENRGACQEALSKEGHTCICPSGFSGSTCSKLKGEACSPYACGVGRCVDTENSFECLCPLGRAGRRCEREITVNEPAFKNGAYIAYPTPRPIRKLKVSLRIKPNDVNDGILLYGSETEEGHGDFISLAIRDRHLEFKFDAGNGVTEIRSNEELVPGHTHLITATRTLSDGRLVVDGGAPVGGRLTGNFKTLQLQTPLYLGGFDKHRIRLNDAVKVSSGFNGCISNISIVGLEINIIQNVTDSANVEDCSGEDGIDNNILPPDYAHENTQRPLSYNNRLTGCSSNPCSNNGRCYPLTPTEYQCTCAPGFTGRNCENPLSLCGQLPCQNQGVCKENNTHYTCDCLLGFTGFNCEQRTELRSDAHFDGNGYLEFNKDLLPHDKNDETETIALELSTNFSNGLIFWHGQQPNEDGQGQDYISLALENGYLEYSFDLGMGPAIIQNQQKKVNDGERHSVILVRTGRRGSIEIDNTWSESGESEGFINSMNTNGNIYIGGAPNIARMTGNRFTQGFNGCIHGFEVQNSQRLDLGMKAINGLNVKPCSSSLDNSIRRHEGELIN